MITKSGETLSAGAVNGLWSDLAGAGAGNTLKTKLEMGNNALQIGSKSAILALGAGIVLTNWVKKIQNDTRRKALIEDLMLTDPIIKGAPKEQVMAFYATINNVAPSISTDKTIVKQLLQHFISFGTIDLPMIKMLAETHGTIEKNKGWGLEKYVG